MQPVDIHGVLKQAGATHLHHANSVTTSCTFLERGGLLSRNFVEYYGLVQTAQPMSDDKDKRFGIWHGVFLDHVDIHSRARAPNKYGPALFVLELDALLGLPPGSDVFVTKKNPVWWRDGQSNSDRWFATPEELQANLSFGDFDKMLVVVTPEQRLVFPRAAATLLLDDPKRTLSSGKDAYAHAETRLQAAAAKGGISLSVAPHPCRNDCACGKQYAARNVEGFQGLEFFFG